MEQIPELLIGETYIHMYTAKTYLLVKCLDDAFSSWPTGPHPIKPCLCSQMWGPQNRINSIVLAFAVYVVGY
jgi:hypothetical protein